MAAFREGGFPYLARKIIHNQYVTKKELRRTKDAHKGEPVPSIIRDYEERLSRGEIKRPGRPFGNCRDTLMKCMVRIKYPKMLRYLQTCRRKNADPWKTLTTKERYSGAPHEVAAQIVRDWYMPYCDWRHVLNIAKSRQ